MGIGGVVKPGFYRERGRPAPGRLRGEVRASRVRGGLLTPPRGAATHTQWGSVGANSPEEPEQGQAEKNAAKAEEAKLTVAQLHELAEAPPPSSRRQERQQALDHQDEGQRAPEGVAVHDACGRPQRRGALLVEPEPCIARKNSDDGSSTMTSLFLLKLCL